MRLLDIFAPPSLAVSPPAKHLLTVHISVLPRCAVYKAGLTPRPARSPLSSRTLPAETDRRPRKVSCVLLVPSLSAYVPSTIGSNACSMSPSLRRTASTGPLSRFPNVSGVPTCSGTSRSRTNHGSSIGRGPSTVPLADYSIPDRPVSWFRADSTP